MLFKFHCNFHQLLTHEFCDVNRFHGILKKMQKRTNPSEILHKTLIVSYIWNIKTFNFAIDVYKHLQCFFNVTKGILTNMFP